MTKKKRIRRLEGQIVKIDLKDGTYAYARVLKEPLFAFYGKSYRSNEAPSLDEIVSLPIIFEFDVMNYAVTDGIWPVMGRVPLTDDLKKIPTFFKQDIITGELFLYREVPELAPHYEVPATYDECMGLERAAVWDPEHAEDRLRDYFAGRPCKWVEPARTPEQFKAWQEEMRRKREAHRSSK